MYFNRDADENGDFKEPNQVKPGCVFGHIIRSLGGGPELVTEGQGIRYIKSVMSDRLSETDRDILRSIQSYADEERLTWSEALQRAKSRFGRE
jgi:hypothetical protein